MHVELGAFLKARRSRTQPAAVGISTYGERRRVPGLRRDEVAALAGLSESYYRDLEQGAALNASPQVLDALARVFQLTPQEHEHMRLLAEPAPRPMSRSRTRDQEMAPEAQGLIEMISGPVLVIDVAADILAWNPLAHALFAGHLDMHAPEHPQERPNLARLIVLDPVSRSLFADWEAKVRDVAAHLRLSAGTWPEYPRLVPLIGELSIRSEEFATAWAGHEVSTCGLEPFCLNHPVAGALTVEQHTMVSPSVPDQTYMMFGTRKGSPSETALARLATLVDEGQATAARAAVKGLIDEGKA
ncbi:MULTISPECIES: helix-turn-helix transcriptional regulator [unclassified Streptomyces]|uniref:helix-turn-helix transcriptional regulator n=1 Tax=unclassified Streptomyces TaxID=2593676 RepID=UPI001485FA64|nr:helix-turn-helix transcriptional regulator [Streptomyces sp. DASNCL29]